MPKVKPGESRDDYVSRCVSYVMDKEGLEQDAALGKCEGMYDQHKKKTDLEAPLEKPGMANENFMRSGEQSGVIAGRYPEIDTTAPLPRTLQPRRSRIDEVDGLDKIKQP